MCNAHVSTKYKPFEKSSYFPVSFMARYSIAPYNIVIQEKGPEQRETLPRDKMRL